MRKIIRISVLIILCFSFQLIIGNASTNTKERTTDNYLVPSNIEVTDNNKNNVLSTPAVDASEKIYDFADLLTEEEEQKLFDRVEKYIDKNKMDLAIVTINYNKKGTAREYADDFFDYNDFGINKTRDGVLFLIDMDTREIYMSTTGNAIIMYDDNRIDESLDQVYKYMTNENYFEGTLNYIQKIDNYATEGIPSSNKGAYFDENGNIQVQKYMPYGILLLFSFGVTLVVIIVLVLKNKLARKATTAKEYLKKETIKINNDGEIFVGTNTVKHRIQSSSGGSSTHIGSSGSSHGGGGHSF